MAGWIHSQLRNQWMGALALFLVVAGGGAYAAFDPVGSDGDVDACFEKKSGDLDLLKGKKCGKGEKPVTWSQQGPAGEPGQQGQPGTAGQDATKLFAYIRDAGAGADAAVDYGSGVTGVTEPAATNGVYDLTFNRSMVGCVVMGNTGSGDPSGTFSSVLETVRAALSFGGPNDVRIDLVTDAGTTSDSAFMVAAFC